MKKGWMIAVAAGLALSAGWAVWSGRDSRPHHAEHAPSLYFCPMHPQVTSPKPGECPICHMRLVPADHPDPASAHKSGPDPAVSPGGLVTEGRITVKIQPDKQQLIGMRLGRAEKKRLRKTIRAVGRVAYDPELYQAQTEFLEAVKAQSGPSASAGWAVALEKSSRTRLKLLGLSDELVVELVREGKADENLLYVRPGEKAWVYATIYEYEIPLVRPGDPIEVTLSARPDARFEGKVRSIDTLVDPQTRTVRVRGTIENRDGSLKPDLFVNVGLGSDLGEVIAVPEDAVVLSGTRALVFVEKEPGVFEPRAVAIGAKAEGFYEIREGIREGETIVTSGNFFVDSESRLKAALESAKG